MTEFYNKLINGNSKKQSLYKAQQYLRTYQNGVYDKPGILGGIHHAGWHKLEKQWR